ncbi:MAG TPA: signal peptidase I [Desulfobacterales bacterium]|nr:signal peptidase I [Desulfobacterales bacterium]
MKTDKPTGGVSIAGVRSRLRENVEAILVAVVIALFIRTFVVQAFKIPSGSMKQTLQVGDHILVNKFVYGVKIPYLNTVLVPVRNPERDDIVVFKFPMDPKKDFIKRVVGIPGDTIEIRDKALMVNGKRIKHDFAVYTDSHVAFGPQRQRDNLGPIIVPADALFVMGDNRDESFDSRFWGFVPLRDVSGKAFIVYWSWDSDQFRIRWSRIANLLS